MTAYSKRNRLTGGSYMNAMLMSIQEKRAEDLKQSGIMAKSQRSPINQYQSVISNNN